MINNIKTNYKIHNKTSYEINNEIDNKTQVKIHSKDEQYNHEDNKIEDKIINKLKRSLCSFISLLLLLTLTLEAAVPRSYSKRPRSLQSNTQSNTQSRQIQTTAQYPSSPLNNTQNNSINPSRALLPMSLFFLGTELGSSLRITKRVTKYPLTNTSKNNRDEELFPMPFLGIRGGYAYFFNPNFGIKTYVNLRFEKNLRDTEIQINDFAFSSTLNLDLMFEPFIVDKIAYGIYLGLGAGYALRNKHQEEYKYDYAGFYLPINVGFHSRGTIFIFEIGANIGLLPLHSQRKKDETYQREATLCTPQTNETNGVRFNCNQISFNQRVWEEVSAKEWAYSFYISYSYAF